MRGGDAAVGRQRTLFKHSFFSLILNTGYCAWKDCSKKPDCPIDNSRFVFKYIGFSVFLTVRFEMFILIASNCSRWSMSTCLCLVKLFRDGKSIIKIRTKEMWQSSPNRWIKWLRCSFYEICRVVSVFNWPLKFILKRLGDLLWDVMFLITRISFVICVA